jgi:hypothetical protein
VSRICQQAKGEFAAFSVKDLSKLRIDYLFLDGTNFRFHEHSPPEPVLCLGHRDRRQAPPRRSRRGQL